MIGSEEDALFADAGRDSLGDRIEDLPIKDDLITGEVEMGELDRTAAVDGGAGDGVLIEPHQADETTEVPDDVARLDVHDLVGEVCAETRRGRRSIVRRWG